MTVFAYIRVSTGKQETENQRFEILKYANEKKLGKVEFIEETVSGRKSWKDSNSRAPERRHSYCYRALQTW
ncbi:recombinase family protein [Thermovibrio sp.]